MPAKARMATMMNIRTTMIRKMRTKTTKTMMKMKMRR
jgi:hypothetical protein